MDLKANARAKTTAEKLKIHPANAPRAKEMRKEPGAREDARELGAKQVSTEKAKESAKLMDMKHKEISTGTGRQRSNRIRRRMSWSKTGIKSPRGAVL